MTRLAKVNYRLINRCVCVCGFVMLCGCLFCGHFGYYTDKGKGQILTKDEPLDLILDKKKRQIQTNYNC